MGPENLREKFECLDRKWESKDKASLKDRFAKDLQEAWSPRYGF